MENIIKSDYHIITADDKRKLLVVMNSIAKTALEDRNIYLLFVAEALMNILDNIE